MADPTGKPTVELAKNKNHRDSYHLLERLQILSVIGCFLILLYACRYFGSHEFLRIVGVGILVAGASLVAGFLLGFIFAIPRDGNEPAGTKTTANSSGSNADDSKGKASRVRPNSNLVEISDWLTKIIVGVGLVELKSLPHKLGSLSYYLGRGLQPTHCDGGPCSPEHFFSGQDAGLAILVFFSSIGFLLGYVWTRLYFAGDLERQIGELEEEKESLEKDKTKLEQDKKELELKTKKVVQDIWLLDVERLLDTDKPDEAMRQIDQALAQQPQDGMFVFTKARILKRQATLPGVPEAQKRQLLDQAIDYANRAIALLPGKPEPIYNKACYEALLDVDKYKKQILADLESAFKMNPGLKKIAADDSDLKDLRDDAEFKRLISESGQPSG